MVWSRTRTSAEILEAIRQGRFYSTTGPRIEEIMVEDGEIRVKTTPVRSVWFASAPWLGVRRVAPAGDCLTGGPGTAFGPGHSRQGRGDD